MQKFMAVDGTFLKAQFIQTLLIAVDIDANEHNLLLTWAIVESENTESWLWFLSQLKTAIPDLQNMTLISDRDKGLFTADIVLGLNVNCLICCFHLKNNFVRRYRGVEQLFWPITNAKTLGEYITHMNKLQQVNKSAAAYLKSIDQALQITAFFAGQSFGHKTSNIAESMNNILKDE